MLDGARGLFPSSYRDLRNRHALLSTAGNYDVMAMLPVIGHSLFSILHGFSRPGPIR